MNKYLFLLLVPLVMACGVASGTLAGLPQTAPTASPVTKSSLENGVYTSTPHTETVTALIALNVRSSGSEDGKIIGYLSNGDAVIVQGECNREGWVWIGMGFVNADYLSGNICEVRK